MKQQEMILKKLNNIQELAEETKKGVKLQVDSGFVESMQELALIISFGLIQSELNELKEIIDSDVKTILEEIKESNPKAYEAILTEVDDPGSR